MKQILIVGACSAIVMQTARQFANAGASIFLLARNEEQLKSLSLDLKTRGSPKVVYKVFDALNFEAHEAIFAEVLKELPELDTLLIGYGTLSDQSRAQRDVHYMLSQISTNYQSVISLTSICANFFEAKARGMIAVISSVAGDRGRQSNYVYGSAKAGLNVYLQGLRNRLASKGVNVLTIKPGFVDTPMTANIKKNFLFASAQSVGQGIYQAMCQGRNEVYLPWYWFWIMLIIKAIPESIFKKLKL